MSIYNQYFTTCRRCGRQILMTRADNGKTIPCEPEIIRFHPGGGPETFVTETGRFLRGERVWNGSEMGYRKHRRDCGG